MEALINQGFHNETPLWSNILHSGIKRRLTCEDLWRKARKQVPRIAELCAEPVDAALCQKDRKAASFYAGREYNKDGIFRFAQDINSLAVRAYFNVGRSSVNRENFAGKVAEIGGKRRQCA